MAFQAESVGLPFAIPQNQAKAPTPKKPTSHKMAEEQLTQTDILRIVRHFLLSSPPGEFEDVLSDVRELVNDDELLNKGALDIFHTYNIEQLIPVDVPGKEHKVILSKYNEISQNQYADPHSNSVLNVNHAKGVVTTVDEQEAPEDEEVAKKRKSLQAAIDSYISDHYMMGLCTVYPSQNDPNKEFIICITASKYNANNFWSGRWRSVYRVSIEEDTKAKISGSMKVNVHYYENGNVQLNSSQEHGETVSSSSFDALATEISKCISKAEGSFQTNIDAACNNLSDTFKSLRRRLPLSKTLYNFRTGSHKITKEMSGK